MEVCTIVSHSHEVEKLPPFFRGVIIGNAAWVVSLLGVGDEQCLEFHSQDAKDAKKSMKTWRSLRLCGEFSVQQGYQHPTERTIEYTNERRKQLWTLKKQMLKQQNE